MSKAMNGKSFERQLRNAAAKLSRVTDGIDPQSGYAAINIVNFIVELPELGNEKQLAQAAAILRRNGYTKQADELVV
jgi:hypothetical protein